MLLKLFPAFLLAGALLTGAGRPAEIPFESRMLDGGANETCALADLNRDGKLDIVSGENWYAAPAWAKTRFRELGFFGNYVDAFSDLPVDANGDGWLDVVTVSWFGGRIGLWTNPGKTGTWKESIVDSGFPVEFALLVDIDNDGKAAEILPQSGAGQTPLAWYEARDGKMVKRVVSDKSYGHGIGAGDVNKDGRTDILTPQGWFEAPADPRSGTWKHHADWSFDAALSFMHVDDLNGDGRNEIITANAHDYGIFYMMQDASGKWQKHMIDESWSQPHATTWFDLNGDGRRDLITGKRYMAHNGRDPGEREPLGVYWYEHRLNAKGEIEWIRHVVDYGSRAGGGMQIPIADLDGDGDLDFVTAGKSGLFFFENKTAPSSKPRQHNSN